MYSHSHRHVLEIVIFFWIHNTTSLSKHYILASTIPLDDMSMTSRYLWWRHQMETFSSLLAICAGNSPVPGEFPAQRPVTRIFDVSFVLRLNKWLSKQWWGWWFETLSCPLWRHCNGNAFRITLCGHFWIPLGKCLWGEAWCIPFRYCDRAVEQTPWRARDVTVMLSIVYRSRKCACFVTWFCYQMIAKPGNKTGPPSWPDPYHLCEIQRTERGWGWGWRVGVSRVTLCTADQLYTQPDNVNTHDRAHLPGYDLKIAAWFGFACGGFFKGTICNRHARAKFTTTHLVWVH